jgi:Polysaccharide pyruvyl transferase
MKFAQMACAGSQNIGDDIQSIAGANRLPRVDLYLDREELDAVQGPDPTLMIMNGWFMHGNRWPPSKFVRPIFVGFHVTPKRKDLIAAHAQYLKRYEPIGTRDKGTADFLNGLGIRAEVTYCLSLTFPTRAKAPANGKVFIVDAGEIKIPRALRRKAIKLTNEFFFYPGLRETTKLQYARELIEFYRDNASLVITTRLHCALPCIAMGIPVVFFRDPSDYRTSVVSDVGGIIYNRRLHGRGLLGRIGQAVEPIDWSPKPLDVTPIKDRLFMEVSTRIEAVKAAHETI